MKIMRFSRVLTFGLGVAVGYYLGNRQGREQAMEAAQQAKHSVQQFWSDPKTQEQIHDVAGTVTDALKEKNPTVGKVAEKAAGLIDKTTGYQGEAEGHSNSPHADADNDRAGHETVDTGSDVISDP
ncbi:MAG TPA: hypothetical protein VIG71_10610, partial [Enteractinococcus sp.]